MNKPRVLAIGLDGYEPSLEDEMIARGELPNLAHLKERGACFALDHGPAQRTGLAWEHFATALSPDDAGRWAAVHLDSKRYEAWQQGTRSTPWEGFSGARTVVFDTPYFDLARAADVRGLVAWGAHDPGIATAARPQVLADEFAHRFGPYPASQWTYGLPWSSAATCAAMGDALARAVDLRAEAARWLFAERLTDWDVGILVVSEPHSAIEGLWHGVDPEHPLYVHPSSAAAGEGLRSVYRAVDSLIGTLRSALPNVLLVVFSLGGMGANASDVSSMALLPEFLYRRAFGRPLMATREDWARTPDGLPRLEPGEDWSQAVNALLPSPSAKAQSRQRSRLAEAIAPALHTLDERLPWRVRQAVRRAHAKWTLARQAQPSATVAGKRPDRQSLDWMPAARYCAYWSRMPAFALPSFYDGRIRLNLRGRESHGMISPRDYAATLDALETDLRGCTNPRTGGSVVAQVERPAADGDPLRLGPTQADLVIVWNTTLAFDHPEIGCVGPLPYRRTGGHTGPYGMAYLWGDGIAPGDFGTRSSFDMPPTIMALAGAPTHALCTGTTFTHALRQDNSDHEEIH